MSIDYGAVLADLESRIAEFHVAINAIRPLVAPRAPRSPEEIRTERRQRDEDIIGEVRRQVETESADRADKPLADRPGKGRKACPKCHAVTGARASECKCGHRFKAAA